MKNRILESTLITALVACAAPAAAQDMGVVLEFSGWKASKARRSVTRAVGEVVDLVPLTRAEDAAEDLDLNLGKRSGLAALAREVGAEVLVRGMVKGRGKRAKTYLTFYDRRGRVIAKKRTVSPGSQRGLRHIGSVAAKVVERALDGGEDEEEEEDEEDEEDEESEEDDDRYERSERSERPERVDRRRRRARVDDDDEDEDEDEAEEDEPAPSMSRRMRDVRRKAERRERRRRAEIEEEKPAPRPIPKDELEDAEEEPIDPGYASNDDEDDEDEDDDADDSVSTSVRSGSNSSFVTARGGTILRARTARVSLTDDRIASHKSGLYPEIAASLQARPFSGGWARGLFANLNMALGVGLSAQNTPDTEVDTSSFRFDIGAGYAYETGRLSLGGSLSMGVDSFSIGTNEVLGSTAYTFVRIGTFGGYEILGKALAARLDFGLRPVLGTGDLGIRYFQTVSAFGVDFSAGVNGEFDNGFTYGFDIGFSRYGLGFESALQTPPPQLATLVSATGGSDLSVLVSFVAGYRFGR